VRIFQQLSRLMLAMTPWHTGCFAEFSVHESAHEPAFRIRSSRRIAMNDDEPRIPAQGPYRRWAGPRVKEDKRDVSAGFVAGFVILIVLLVKVLSVDPRPSESFGWHSAGYCAGHSPASHRP
jgi:hypothetical protein